MKKIKKIAASIMAVAAMATVPVAVTAYADTINIDYSTTDADENESPSRAVQYAYGSHSTLEYQRLSHYYATAAYGFDSYYSGEHLVRALLEARNTYGTVLATCENNDVIPYYGSVWVGASKASDYNNVTFASIRHRGIMYYGDTVSSGQQDTASANTVY